MAKKVKKVKRSRLADDILLSFNEALKYARGEKADIIVHRVTPSGTDPARYVPKRDARVKPAHDGQGYVSNSRATITPSPDKK